jgi:hypothetical protein
MSALVCRNDRKVLFTALGFLAVILKGESGADQGKHALELADLIESFCRFHLPDAFESQPDSTDASSLDHVTSVITDILNSKGTCSRQDLRDHGFAEDEIERHWRMAYALACVAFNIKPVVS